MKKTSIIFIFLGIFSLLAVCTKAQEHQKHAYYEALAGNALSVVDKQLQVVSGFSGSEKDAFEGALLMKKAGFMSTPAKKLSVFKQGNKKLESVISNNPGNAEYRFLRLMIQENAPKVLGYNKNMAQDSKLIKENYSKLSADARQAVMAYSKKSKILAAGSF